MVERQILWNQLEILGSVGRRDAADVKKGQRILEAGYTLHYDQVVHLARGGGTTLREEDARFVRQVLDMMDGLFRYHSERAGSIRFRGDEFMGFDGNNETELMSYAQFLVQVDKSWTYLNIKNFNSHLPMRERYQRMLVVWEDFPMPEAITSLTDAQVERIRDAGM